MRESVPRAVWYVGCVVAALSMLIGLPSCTTGPEITAQERLLIADHASNARNFDRVVQSHPTASDNDSSVPIPKYIKDWMQAEVRTWNAFEAWVYERKPRDAEIEE